MGSQSGKFEKVTREEIACRNYTEGTTRAYLRALHDLAGYFHQSPERLTREQIPDDRFDMVCVYP